MFKNFNNAFCKGRMEVNLKTDEVTDLFKFCGY